MFNILFSMFKSNCKPLYKRNMQRYLYCVYNNKFTIDNTDNTIYVIYKNINIYLDIADIFINYDYEKYISYDAFTYVKIKREIYLKDFFTDEEYILRDKETLLRELINKTMSLIDIYYLLKNNTDDRINLFNSNILKQYIINVVDIVNISINHK